MNLNKLKEQSISLEEFSDNILKEKGFDISHVEYFVIKNENYRHGSSEGLSSEVYSKDKSKIEKYFKDNVKSAIYDDIKDGTTNWTITKDTDEEFIYESPNGNWEYIYWISTANFNIIE